MYSANSIRGEAVRSDYLKPLDGFLLCAYHHRYLCAAQLIATMPNGRQRIPWPACCAGDAAMG